MFCHKNTLHFSTSSLSPAGMDWWSHAGCGFFSALPSTFLNINRSNQAIVFFPLLVFVFRWSKLLHFVWFSLKITDVFVKGKSSGATFSTAFDIWPCRSRKTQVWPIKLIIMAEIHSGVPVTGLCYCASWVTVMAYWDTWMEWGHHQRY